MAMYGFQFLLQEANIAKARLKYPEIFAFHETRLNDTWVPLLVYVGAEVKLPQIHHAPRIKNITLELVQSLTPDQLRWVRSMQSSLTEFRKAQIEIGRRAPWCPAQFGRGVVKRWLDWATKIALLSSKEGGTTGMLQ